MTAPRTVGEYLAATPPRDRAALRKLRATIRAAAPGATETISYQMPAFRTHGRSLVSYAAFRDHYSLFPMGLSVVNANRARLAPYLSGRSTLRFSFDEPLPVAIVRLVVKARLADNAARQTASRDGARRVEAGRRPSSRSRSVGASRSASR